jgi:eukaryotic-like serine/threonine-protein kinase
MESLVQASAVEQDDPGPGDIVAGKYRIDRVLGAGGMGLVLAATHLDLGRPVALKMLRRELTSQPTVTARVMREARAAAALRHENVVQIFDVGRLDSGMPFIVMELLDGRDLDQLVRDRGPLPVSEAVRYVRQVCTALAEAHSLGIIHRDMKPSNILVVPTKAGPSMVKVVDFGISKVGKLGADIDESGQLTDTADMLGSPQFISPEQLRNPREVDGRTDIWALGVILHKLMTAQLPFRAKTLGAYLLEVVNGAPQALRHRRPEAPAQLEAIILRCLAKNLDDRFATTIELATALAPFERTGGAEGVLHADGQGETEGAGATAHAIARAPASSAAPAERETVVDRRNNARQENVTEATKQSAPQASPGPLSSTPPSNTDAVAEAPLERSMVALRPVIAPIAAARPQEPHKGRRMAAVAVLLTAIGAVGIVWRTSRTTTDVSSATSPALAAAPITESPAASSGSRETDAGPQHSPSATASASTFATERPAPPASSANSVPSGRGTGPARSSGKSTAPSAKPAPGPALTSFVPSVL